FRRVLFRSQPAADSQQAGEDADQRAEGKEGEQQGQHRGQGRIQGADKGSAAPCRRLPLRQASPALRYSRSRAFPHPVLPMKRVIFTVALAVLALPGTTSAQSADSQLRAALEAAGSGRPVPTHMASHPAYGWIEFASLRRDLASLPGDRAQSFL